MRLNCSSSLSWYIVAGLLAVHPVHAQLLSCDEIGCPVNSYMQSTCQVNGSRITTLGFTNFTTSFTTEPLSWTVGYEVDPDNFYGNGTDERFYYLGTPPTLDLNSISSLSGCALSFVGIQGELSFAPPSSTAPDVHRSSGTCADALGTACVSDLIQQSVKYTNDLRGNGTFQCSSLASMLENDPPTSCSMASTTWGDILAKDLTGPESASKVELGTCRPTVNQTYDIRIVESQSSTSQRNLFNVITPILTIFAPVSDPRDGDIGPILGTAEAQLSCLKPVSNKQTPGDVVVAGDARESLSSQPNLWLLLGLILWSVVW